VLEIAAALGFGEQDAAAQFPETLHRALGPVAQQLLELAEDSSIGLRSGEYGGR
jgi:hypothetical protein